MAKVADGLKLRSEWIIDRFEGNVTMQDIESGKAKPIKTTRIEGNLGLNEGIQLLEDLLIGAGGTVFNNANAYLGVGDSDTAESATQTGLQASTNKLYKAMEASYPSRSSQTVSWRSLFGTGDANFAWKEFTVANGNSDSAVNLNRKVSDQGTKPDTQAWMLTLQVTVS